MEKPWVGMGAIPKELLDAQDLPRLLAGSDETGRGWSRVKLGPWGLAALCGAGHRRADLRPSIPHLKKGELTRGGDSPQAGLG